MPAGKKTADPLVAVDDAAAWEAWLEKHHATSRGAWLVIAKKGSKLGSPTYQEALELCLCFGWIDGQKRAKDEDCWVQRFCPRGPKSIWSKINVEKAARLIAARKMRVPGLAAIESAKADGRWDNAYAGQRSATPPPDLTAALDQSPEAKAFFATLSSANRYAIIFRIGNVKRPETRARKIAGYVQMLEQHKTLHAPKK